MHFSHYSPTAPFSLRCEPYMQDYMVMEQLPHIMIAGKAKEYRSKRMSVGSGEVLLVTIPEGQAGLVSLDRAESAWFII